MRNWMESKYKTLYCRISAGAHRSANTGAERMLDPAWAERKCRDRNRFPQPGKYRDFGATTWRIDWSEIMDRCRRYDKDKG